MQARDDNSITAAPPAEGLSEEEQAQADQEQAAWAAAEAAANELMAEEEQAQAKQQLAVLKELPRRLRSRSRRPRNSCSCHKLRAVISHHPQKLLNLQLQQQQLTHLRSLTMLSWRMLLTQTSYRQCALCQLSTKKVSRPKLRLDLVPCSSSSSSTTSSSSSSEVC